MGIKYGLNLKAVREMIRVMEKSLSSLDVYLKLCCLDQRIGRECYMQSLF